MPKNGKDSLRRIRTSEFVLTSVWVALSVTSCGQAESDKVSREDCQELRTHRADLRLAKVKENIKDQTGEVELAKHRKILENSGGEAFIDECVESRTPKWMECALDATTLNAIEDCR